MTGLDVLLSLFVYCSGPSGRPRALLTESRSVRPSYRRQQTVCSVCLDTSCAIHDHEDTNHQAATAQAMPGEALHTRRRLQVVHCVTANRCTGPHTPNLIFHFSTRAFLSDMFFCTDEALHWFFVWTAMDKHIISL